MTLTKGVWFYIEGVSGCWVIGLLGFWLVLGFIIIYKYHIYVYSNF